MSRKIYFIFASVAACAVLFVLVLNLSSYYSMEYIATDGARSTPAVVTIVRPQLDKKAYDQKMLLLAHISSSTIQSLNFATTTGDYTLSSFTKKSLASSTVRNWPTRTMYPNVSALLPFNRIVAYYGNFYSKGMGVLGEADASTTLAKLRKVAAQWKSADPSTPVIPAIDYIAVTAQGSAGKDGKYRVEMPDSQIDKALDMAHQVHGIVILDVQVGLSTLQQELPEFSKYLSMPDVHLAIDPEFAMRNHVPPGHEIGVFSAADINYAAQYLQSLVQKNNLPPKLLIVHRFTEDMVTNYRAIKPLPEVQVVMDMDGWGDGTKKVGTYSAVIAAEPVQFTGFKLFYKNDIKPPSTRMLTPLEILQLTPAPSFIQYQ